VDATFDGTVVRTGPEGLALYEQGGYGRPERGGLRLAPVEALYLVHRGKIAVGGHDFDALLATFSAEPTFLRSYLVYRDIRERGYVVQTGPQDFRVFRRGQKPSSGHSQYMVRVLSERDLISFEDLGREATASDHMRKQHVLAVVDDEDELTYYEIHLGALADAAIPPATPIPETHAGLYGAFAIAQVISPSVLETMFYGTRLDSERLLLAPVEVIFLLGDGSLRLECDNELFSSEEYVGIAESRDAELHEKVAVYTDLRRRGYMPRTGYKFGHHFRVYRGATTHSELLAHAIPAGSALPMAEISRSVRLAHSVKKRMLFACVTSTGIQYIEFGRIKL
jgi:tRNA-intron endonuclease